MKLRNLLAGATIALPLALGSAYAQSSDPAKTLVVAVPSDAVGLEPGANKAEPIGSEVILNVFDTLVEIGLGDGRIDPRLAAGLARDLLPRPSLRRPPRKTR